MSSFFLFNFTYKIGRNIFFKTNSVTLKYIALMDKNEKCLVFTPYPTLHLVPHSLYTYRKLQKKTFSSFIIKIAYLLYFFLFSFSFFYITTFDKQTTTMMPTTTTMMMLKK